MKSNPKFDQFVLAQDNLHEVLSLSGLEVTKIGDETTDHRRYILLRFEFVNRDALLLVMTKYLGQVFTLAIVDKVGQLTFYENTDGEDMQFIPIMVQKYKQFTGMFR